MKIAICDDNNLELQQIKTIVQEFINLKQPARMLTIHAFTNGNDLLQYIQKYGGFDLLILDIIMPGLNGLALAAKLRENNENSRIIFLTSSLEFAIDSYKVNAWYYLLKSSAGTELQPLLERALEETEREDALSVIVKEKGKYTRVHIHTISYLECVNHTVYFHLRGNETISSYSTINEFHNVLLSDKRFVKCHKSFVVNMSYVTGITSKDFVLEGGARVPISRNIFQQVKDAYFDYFF